jgi:ribosomal peptide maturation radical SAM protein 1
MDVCLVVVPFADVERPSIGVSLLSAELARAGFDCRVRYVNFDFAESIGRRLYTDMSESLPADSLVGDWFFADLVFGSEIPPAEQYVQRVLSRFASPALIAQILAARAQREAFLDSSVRTIAEGRPRIVGFSTTFHQTCVSLALARRLKALPDPPIMVFGGANCEGEMGLQMLRSFPWLDFVCTREGDVAFPRLVARLLAGDPAIDIPGMLAQGHADVLGTPDLIEHLDDLPDPDYSDYFERVSRCNAAFDLKPELLVETARGCWWGAKHHCTFCGLNGDTMAYRSKSPERAYDEMCRLSQRWGVAKMDSVDNILDLRYFDTLFPRLAKLQPPLDLFYEIKANLKLRQVAALRAAGVRTVQPGIESLATEVLQLMDKGCTALQNIQLLRWCEEFGITVAWNMLAGFPGEVPATYDRQAELCSKLVHLQPPSSCSPIRLDRFSPLYGKAEAFGLRRVRPSAAYFYVYPLGRRDMARLASFFDFEYDDGREPIRYVAAAQRAVERWIALRHTDSTIRPCFDATFDGDGLRIVDTRPEARCEVSVLSGPLAALYVACDEAATLATLTRKFAAELPASTIDTLIAQWIADRWCIEMDGRILSLAVFRNRPLAATTHRPNVRISIAAASVAEPLPSAA